MILAKMPDGSIRRTLIAPKTHQAKQARAWKAKTEAAKIRHDLNLTQADFATLLGVSLATIRKWERATGQPSGAAKTLLIVARQHPEVIREALAADQG
jgi:putative transcriptional regulator